MPDDDPVLDLAALQRAREDLNDPELALTPPYAAVDDRDDEISIVYDDGRGNLTPASEVDLEPDNEICDGCEREIINNERFARIGKYAHADFILCANCMVTDANPFTHIKSKDELEPDSPRIPGKQIVGLLRASGIKVTLDIYAVFPDWEVTDIRFEGVPGEKMKMVMDVVPVDRKFKVTGDRECDLWFI